MSGQPNASFTSSSLPVGQLESAKFKLIQMMESIIALQRTVEAGGQNVMPPWPDILSKFNVLLSQTHNINISLIAPLSSQAPGGDSSSSTARGIASKPFSRLVLHPSISLPDSQLDNELIPLLRNQQTTEVLRLENDTVRRIAERLPTASMQKERPNAPETYEAVLQVCERIREEHDARCDRAIRAVNLLREKYDWKARVAVEIEELDDDSIPSSVSPTNPLSPFSRLSSVQLAQESMDEDEESAAISMEVNDEVADGDSGEDDAELEDVLGPSLRSSDVDNSRSSPT